jgi:hypothetical protein
MSFPIYVLHLGECEPTIVGIPRPVSAVMLPSRHRDAGDYRRRCRDHRGRRSARPLRGCGDSRGVGRRGPRCRTCVLPGAVQRVQPARVEVEYARGREQDHLQRLRGQRVHAAERQLMPKASRRRAPCGGVTLLPTGRWRDCEQCR